MHLSGKLHRLPEAKANVLDKWSYRPDKAQEPALLKKVEYI